MSPLRSPALPGQRSLWLAIGTLLVTGLALSGPATAEVEPRLRSARELAPAAAPQTEKPGELGVRRAPLALGGPDSGTLFLRADLIEGNQREVEASGQVELRARRETVLADRLTYEFATQEIRASGNVTLRQGYDFVSGSELVFRQEQETGYFENPHFGIGEIGARGEAQKVEFKGPGRFEVLFGRVTTCVAPREDWFLSGERIEIDNEKKVGVAHDARLDFLGVPILYTPWLEFPLSNERKSGFLTPTFGQSGIRGFDFTLPYYLNLAPNYDLTLFPRVMTKRGVQLGAQFRYISETPSPFHGDLVGEILPDDRETDSTRWLLSWRHNQQFTPWLTGWANINRVSDDKYFADLSERVAITSQSTLVQEGGLLAQFGNVSVMARAQNFQTLQDPNAPIVPPYNRIPQVLATLAPTEWQGLNFSGFTEYARFSQDDVVSGNRAVFYPQVEWRRETPGWFFAARGSLHARAYDLSDVPGAGDRTPTVALPIVSLDGGMTFERPLRAFDSDFIQTLEPRAFYLYVPYRDQSGLPVFDSALEDFNFVQLFSENRYLGNDRIGDANQLTTALTTRLIDADSGVERLRVSAGQRFYFQGQRVTLPNEVPRSGSSSDLLLGVEGRITDAWALHGLTQFNFDNGENERWNLGVRYNPEPGKILVASYRYNRELVDPGGGTTDELKQFDIAGQWPIDDQWTLIGRWNYSLVQSKTLEALVGVEYNADCWVLRAVLHRLTTTSEQSTTSVFLQLELNGLARVGTSPLELLRRSVPGFLRSNDPTRQWRGPGIDPYPEF